MKVKEAIEALSKFPPELEVEIFNPVVSETYHLVRFEENATFNKDVQWVEPIFE